MTSPVQERLRIAQIVTFMDMGGVSDHVLSLVRGLRRKHDVTVICGGADPQHRAALEAIGVELVIIPLTRAPNPISDIRAFWSLWRLLRERQFDIVNTHRSKATLIGLLAARCAGAPTVINTAHMFGCFALPNPILRRVFWAYDKALFAMGADAVITVSERVRAAAITIGLIPENKIYAIHNGIELQPFVHQADSGQLRRALGVEPDAVLITTVARLVRSKGLDLLIAAAAKVIASRPHTRLLIVGDGPLRDALAAQVEQLRLTRHVLFAGRRNDVPDLLRASDLFAMSSLTEGLPIAILEAMAAGKPVVAATAPVDGIPEAIAHGETGLIVSSRDVDDLAAALGLLVDDRELRERFGRNARKMLEQRFSAERMVGDVEELYGAMRSRRREALAQLQ